MMGPSHAKSGLTVGLALAAAVGYRDPIAALPFAIVVAGYSLTAFP